MNVDESATTVQETSAEPPKRTVLVPFFEAEGSAQLLALADWVARDADSALVVLISTTYPEQTPLARASADLDASERERERARRIVDVATDRLGADIDVEAYLLTDDESAAAIVTQAAQYDATVIGAPRQNRLRQFVYGPTTGPVRDDVRTPVLTVRSGQAPRSWLDTGDEESIA